MPDVRIKKKEESEIDTILAEDIDFTGVVNFVKPLMVKGKISGEIKATGDLYIAEKAEITATIEANLVSAKGRINGNIKAVSRVELFSTAIVKGDLETPELEMESGSRFNGYCNMSAKKRENYHEG